MDARLHRQLSLIDWDFITGDEAASAGIHWYPGSFVPSLPGALIEALSSQDDRVFDPYGGVGTTGIAAVVRGRGVLCCDLSPIAVLSSFTAICLLSLRYERPNLFDAVFAELDALLNSEGPSQMSLLLRTAHRLRDVDAHINSISDRTPLQIYKRIRVGPAQQAALKPWYERGTLLKLTRILARVEDFRESVFVRLVGLAMISAVARILSSQTRSWGHVADNVFPHTLEHKDVAQASRNWLWRTHRRLGRISQLAPLPKARPFFFPRMVDWASWKRDLPVGFARLFVTSPPYAGAIDYTLAHRLSLHLLGRTEEDISALCRQEMGARRKRFSDSHVSVWADQLSSMTATQLSLLGNASFAAFVMPHKDAGRKLGEETLRKTMNDMGWAPVFARDRSIRQARARQSWTSIKRETILIFERQGGK